MVVRPFLALSSASCTICNDILSTTYWSGQVRNYVPVHFRYQELTLPRPVTISLDPLLGHELLLHVVSAPLTTECPWIQHLYCNPVCDIYDDKLGGNGDMHDGKHEVMVTCTMKIRGKGDMYDDKHRVMVTCMMASMR